MTGLTVGVSCVARNDPFANDMASSATESTARQTETRRSPFGRFARWSLVVLSVTTAGANLITRQYTLPHLFTSAEQLQGDVAIVPGASVYRDGTPSPQLLERLTAALMLFKMKRVRGILVSGARHGAYDEAGAMKHWLVSHGVDTRLVFEDPAGFRTLDTMERAARVFAVKTPVICTQTFHLPRAVFLARRAGLDATGLPANQDLRTIGISDWIRESFASVMAVVDSFVLHRGPRDLGTGAPIVFPHTTRP